MATGTLAAVASARWETGVAFPADLLVAAGVKNNQSIRTSSLIIFFGALVLGCQHFE